MLNPGTYPLFVGPITAIAAPGVQPVLGVDLSGITALTLIANFKYGSGGATCSAVVQACSSLDNTLALDIARFDFLMASRVAYCNLEGLLSVAPATWTALASEGRNDGLLLDQLQAVLIVGSTPYVGTTLSLLASCR